MGGVSRASEWAWTDAEMALRLTGGRANTGPVGEVSTGCWAPPSGPKRREGGPRKLTEQLARGSRYAFLLDKALLICKRRGDSYDLKDFVNLHNFQVRDDSSGERDNKKVRF